MGACNFDQLVIVKGDAKIAYREARNQAKDENGHRDGYSGDIQTTTGFFMMNNFPSFESKKFFDWIDDQVSDNSKIEKWGNCGCIELTGTALTKVKKRFGLNGKRGYRAYMFFGWGAE